MQLKKKRATPKLKKSFQSCGFGCLRECFGLGACNFKASSVVPFGFPFLLPFLGCFSAPDHFRFRGTLENFLGCWIEAFLGCCLTTRFKGFLGAVLSSHVDAWTTAWQKKSHFSCLWFFPEEEEATFSCTSGLVLNFAGRKFSKPQPVRCMWQPWSFWNLVWVCLCVCVWVSVTPFSLVVLGFKFGIKKNYCDILYK